jgi:hypothetical protein
MQQAGAGVTDEATHGSYGVQRRKTRPAKAWEVDRMHAQIHTAATARDRPFTRNYNVWVPPGAVEMLQETE